MKNILSTSHAPPPKSPPKSDISALPVNDIINGEASEVMQNWPSNSIDLVVTSPPYDAIREYKGFSLDLLAIGKEVFRLLKPGGVAIVIIQDSTKDFGKSLTSFRTAIDWCDNIGFKLFECVIYSKNGREGAWWGKRFRVDHEYMHIFLKGERPQYFNKENIKIPTKHGGKKLTGGTDRLTNGKLRKIKPMTINPTKCPGTIWHYATSSTEGNKTKLQHPATFPDKMASDFIQCFCPVDGIVLDPMAGSGSTLIAAKKLGRKYVGIDIAEEYCNIIRQRLATEGK